MRKGKKSNQKHGNSSRRRGFTTKTINLNENDLQALLRIKEKLQTTETDAVRRAIRQIDRMLESDLITLNF